MTLVPSIGSENILSVLNEYMARIPTGTAPTASWIITRFGLRLLALLGVPSS